MYKTLSVLFLTIFLSSFSKAEVVKKIEISGNKRVGTETIKIYGNIKRGEDYQKKDLNNILKNLYGTNFFSNVNVKLTNNVLRIELEEYPLINQLIVVGEPKTKYVEEIKKFISLKQNDSFITSKLQQDVGKIKEIYKSLGYNSVGVETKVRAIDKDNLDLVFEIEKGNQTKIKKITFTGDKKIKEKRLRDVIASEEDKFWKIISKNSKFNQNLVGLDQRLLKNYYKSLGYYDVEILSSSAEIKESGHVELTYSIEAGKRYLINKITTNADVIDKKIFYPLSEKYKKYIGSYYSPFKVQKILEEIDEIIDNNNLQFVEHNVEETIANDTISVQFNIFQGERILVERINILGNTITNEAVIRAELEIDEGDPYTDLGLDKSVANLKSRNIFKNIKTTVQAGSSKDLKVVDITVEEKPTGEISAGAGFGTNGGSFAFTVKENNWLGEGKQVSFEIDASADALKGTLNYNDPNYDFLGNAINYYLSSTSNDKPDQGYENTLMSVGAGTRFEQYKDVFVKLGLSASYDDLRTTGTASDSLKKQSGEFSEIAGNYGFTLDRRNRSFMPTDGEILSFSQMVPFYADRTYLDSALSSSLYRSLSENVINSTKFFATAITGLNDDDVRISKRKYLSVRKLRGFRKGKVGPKDGLDHIGGNYAASLNFEASLPNILPESTNTDVGFFLDFGNVWGVDYDSTIDDKNKIRSSTGGVINWISPLGPMSFVFSQNISKASTDETESFNFQLGTSF